MKIQDNFTDTHLLFSTPVSFTIYNDDGTILLAKFKLKLPTVADLYFDEDVAYCLSFLKRTPQELSQQLQVDMKWSSHLDLFRSMFILGAHVPGIAIIWSRVLEGFNKLCPDFVVSDGVFKIQGAEMNDELLERIRDIWLIASGNKTYSKAYSYMTPEQRAYEDKIQQIKNKGKSTDKRSTSFEKVYMILTYEFGYTRQEILSMTMHAVNAIVKYTPKSINYKLTLAAKANGNTKKVKFITDQGD